MSAKKKITKISIEITIPNSTPSPIHWVETPLASHLGFAWLISAWRKLPWWTWFLVHPQLTSAKRLPKILKKIFPMICCPIKLKKQINFIRTSDVPKGITHGITVLKEVIPLVDFSWTLKIAFRGFYYSIRR